MKFISLIFITFFYLNSFSQEQAELKFDCLIIDYGKIKKETNGARTFKFKNIGKKELKIIDAKSTCGCTVPKIPNKPIKPGEVGEIEVVYDTYRIGKFSKTITVYSNAKNKRVVLKIKGVVEKK